MSALAEPPPGIEQVRCGPCAGTGYEWRWVWKVNTRLMCPTCKGTGSLLRRIESDGG